MAVEIAKDSSDLLPPLKAVMAALSVLIKNYDVSPPQYPTLLIVDRFLQQTAANAEQIREIEERVQSLGDVLATQVVDQDIEEKARREALKKFESSCSRIAGTSLNRIRYPQGVS